MKALGRYDTTLQMFIETSKDVDMKRLTFIRWLVEQGRCEHAAVGAPAGELVTQPSTEELGVAA